jgi:hypothetical protein
MFYFVKGASMAVIKGTMEFIGEAEPEEYAGVTIPCIYADGVMSLSWAPHTAKFYFGRFDSPPQGKQGVASLPVAQVVMPMDGFSNGIKFLVERLTALKGHDALRRDTLTEIKRLCDEALKA